MAEPDWLAEGFEQNRARLRAVAYRMLGSFAEAEDAVQEAWLRLSRSDAGAVDNLGGWLTTIVARVCLNVLRSRHTRREEPMGVHVPDPVISRADGASPEDEVLLADSVGLALQVVLETLAPPSGWRSSCTTCSTCPSTRSPRWWGVPRPRPGSSPAGPGAGCGEPTSRPPTAISAVSGKWSTPSSRRRTTATSMRSSRSSTQTSCCDPTAGRCIRMLPWCSTARRPLPAGRS